MLTLELAGVALALLPQKAVLLPAERTLLLADVHIGKAAAFRRLGVPVPRGTTGETLQVLSGLVERHAVRQVVFLGDLMHAAHGRAPGTLAALAQWRERHPRLELTLVRGNHDRHAGDPPAAFGARCIDEPWLHAGLALRHHPAAPPPGAALALAGHLHPCIGAGRGPGRLRLACFHWCGGVLVLPAFGAFTGMQPIRRTPGDRVFAIGGDGVVELP